MVQNQARIVVIGGGITGCSVLYHLARAGVTDVMLVEKGELTSGATCQAAGMLTQDIFYNRYKFPGPCPCTLRGQLFDQQ